MGEEKPKRSPGRPVTTGTGHGKGNAPLQVRLDPDLMARVRAAHGKGAADWVRSLIEANLSDAARR